MKNLFLTGIAGLICWQCFGQAEEIIEKKSTHYVGIQANQLLRQLFNLGGSSTAVNNPYMITYSVNSNATGWGFAAGLGYTYNQFREGDPFNPLVTTINDFVLRAGVDRKTSIGKKWLLGYGFDLLRESMKNETESKSQFGNFTSKTDNSAFGFGPRATLNFSITDRILLGTEATYYFKKSKETREVSSQPTSTEKFKRFAVAVPAVLFVSVKF